MKVRIYTLGKQKFICEMQVKSKYEDSFYFQPMPTISGRRCAKILNNLYPHFKAEQETLVFEKDNGFTWTQDLHRNGTILIG